MASEKRPCQLCGKERYLTRCWVGISFFMTGRMMRLCDSCIDSLRERHMHVIVDDDEEEPPCRE